MAQNKLTVGELVYRISGDMENLKSELKEAKRRVGQLEGEMDRTQKTTNSLSGRLGKLKTAAVAAAAVIGYQLARAFRFAVNAASDLQESTNAVNVVFGQAAERVLEFGQTAARSVGLATAEFNQLASQTGALLKDTGLSMNEVAEETINLTVRAADLASVYNTSVQDALSAINQAIRGETEAIRRYTGDVTDATLEQYALANGIQASVTEMSQQEKRLLRVQVLMEQTNDVAGDFDKTSADLANRQRILRAELTNVSARIGTALLPALENLAGAALDTTGSLEITTKKVNDMGETFYQISNGIIATAKGTAQGVRVLVGAIQTFVLTVASLARQFVGLMDSVGGVFGVEHLDNVKKDIDGFLLELESRMDKNRKTIKENASDVQTALSEALDPQGYEGISQNQVADTLTGIQEASKGVAGSAGDAGKATGDFSDKILDLAKSAREANQELGEELSNTINEFGDDIRSNVRETVSSLAEIVVSAEEEITRLEEERKQARRDDNMDRVREIREQIEEQEKILEEREGFEERQADRITAIRERLAEAGIDVEEAGLDKIMNIRSLEEQIEEERRLASLSEFQRFEEQQSKELALLTDKFITETTLLQQKIKKQKNYEKELTSFLTSEQGKRLENTEAWAQKTIDKYGEVARSLQDLLSTESQIQGLQRSEVPRSPSSVVQNGAASTVQNRQNTVNNTTNVEAPVTINGQGIENLGIETISAIMGFEIEKRVRK